MNFAAQIYKIAIGTFEIRPIRGQHFQNLMVSNLVCLFDDTTIDTLDTTITLAHSENFLTVKESCLTMNTALPSL